MAVKNKSYAEVALIEQSGIVNKIHIYDEVLNISNLNQNSFNNFSYVEEVSLSPSFKLPPSSSLSL